MPLRVSTRGRYGVRLMVALAVNYGRGPTLLRDVSRRESISEKYLGQIVIPLKSAGLVSSQRGSRGGYSLAQPPASVTVKDVIEAIEGKIAPVPCVDDPEGCARSGSCTASSVWKKLGDDIVRSLSSFTLADLAREARRFAGPRASYDI
jgi:Rrf2 family protein